MDGRWRALAAGLLIAAAAGAPAQPMKLAGSVTLVNAVLAPHRDRIEKASGQTLQVAANETGKGLADLTDRAADIAMISAPLDVAMALAGADGQAGNSKRPACACTSSPRTTSCSRCTPQIRSAS